MPKAPTKAQHETQPAPPVGSSEQSMNSQPIEPSTVGHQRQPIEPEPAEIVDAHRTERSVEDMGGEID